MRQDRPGWRFELRSRGWFVHRSTSLHAGEGLADVKAERRVEGKRAIVKGSLHQPDSCCAALVGTVDDRLHELAADAPVLDGRVDGDGADAADDGAFIESVAADDAAVAFGDDAVDAGCGEEHGDDSNGYISVGEVTGKTVDGVDGAEGVVTDLAAGGGVLRSGAANEYVGLRFRRDHANRPWIFCERSISVAGPSQSQV